MTDHYIKTLTRNLAAADSIFTTRMMAKYHFTKNETKTFYNKIVLREQFSLELFITADESLQ